MCEIFGIRRVFLFGAYPKFLFGERGAALGVTALMRAFYWTASIYTRQASSSASRSRLSILGD